MPVRVTVGDQQLIFETEEQARNAIQRMELGMSTIEEETKNNVMTAPKVDLNPDISNQPEQKPQAFGPGKTAAYNFMNTATLGAGPALSALLGEAVQGNPSVIEGGPSFLGRAEQRMTDLNQAAALGNQENPLSGMAGDIAGYGTALPAGLIQGAGNATLQGYRALTNPQGMAKLGSTLQSFIQGAGKGLGLTGVQAIKDKELPSWQQAIANIALGGTMESAGYIAQQGAKTTAQEAFGGAAQKAQKALELQKEGVAGGKYIPPVGAPQWSSRLVKTANKGGKLMDSALQAEGGKAIRINMNADELTTLNRLSTTLGNRLDTAEKGLVNRFMRNVQSGKTVTMEDAHKVQSLLKSKLSYASKEAIRSGQANSDVGQGALKLSKTIVNEMGKKMSPDNFLKYTEGARKYQAITLNKILTDSLNQGRPLRGDVLGTFMSSIGKNFAPLLETMGSFMRSPGALGAVAEGTRTQVDPEMKELLKNKKDTINVE